MVRQVAVVGFEVKDKKRDLLPEQFIQQVVEEGRFPDTGPPDQEQVFAELFWCQPDRAALRIRAEMERTVERGIKLAEWLR